MRPPTPTETESSIRGWPTTSRSTGTATRRRAGREYESICSLNGFLLMQHATGPMYNPVPRRATMRDVCVVDAVYTDTGKLVTYPYYLSVWRRIARRLRKTADRPGPPHGHPLFDGFPWSAAAFTEALTSMASDTA